MAEEDAPGSRFGPKWLIAGLLAFIAATAAVALHRHDARLGASPAASAAAGVRPERLAATAAPANAAAASVPTVGFIAERNEDSAAWFARALVDGLRAQPGIDIQTVPGDDWRATLLALDVQPRVAVARYDLLQEARRAPGVQPVPPLQLIAPLMTEVLYFVVRADSPLTRVHEIRGKEIDIGPAPGARALTAQRAYRLMFGTPIPASDRSALDEYSALDRLLIDKSIDVAVIVGNGAQSPLARYAPLAAHGLKLLAFDDTDPAASRAIRAFLPVTVSDGALGRFPGGEIKTLGVVSFLVTAGGGTGDDPAAHDRAIGAFAAALCPALQKVRQQSNGSWRAIPPSLQIDAGWPYSAAAQAVLADCKVDPSSSAEAANRGRPQPAA